MLFTGDNMSRSKHNIPPIVDKCEDQELKQAAIAAFTSITATDVEKNRALFKVIQFSKAQRAAKLKPIIAQKTQEWEDFFLVHWPHASGRSS